MADPQKGLLGTFGVSLRSEIFHSSSKVGPDLLRLLQIVFMPDEPSCPRVFARLYRPPQDCDYCFCMSVDAQIDSIKAG